MEEPLELLLRLFIDTGKKILSRNFQQRSVVSSKLVVEAAILAVVSASSLSGIPLCPGIHRNVVCLGLALRSDLR